MHWLGLRDSRHPLASPPATLQDRSAVHAGRHTHPPAPSLTSRLDKPFAYEEKFLAQFSAQVSLPATSGATEVGGNGTLTASAQRTESTEQIQLFRRKVLAWHGMAWRGLGIGIGRARSEHTPLRLICSCVVTYVQRGRQRRHNEASSVVQKAATPSYPRLTMRPNVDPIRDSVDQFPAMRNFRQPAPFSRFTACHSPRTHQHGRLAISTSPWTPCDR